MLNELGQPLAAGRTAEIYPWENGRVVKLFFPWVRQEAIEAEAAKGRLIYSSFLPVPAVGEIVRVGERTGILYQLIDGRTLTEMLLEHPARFRAYARLAAQYHVELHTRNFHYDLPAQRERLVDNIHAAGLSAQVEARVLTRLDALPDSARLCHGDFHPDNLLITAQGVTIIDWNDATVGNPLADLARTTLLLQGAAASGRLKRRWQRWLVQVFQSEYLREYFRLNPGGQAEYRRWLPVMAAARLSENIAAEALWLRSQVILGLQNDNA